jgi:hypothetical protein
VVKEKEKKIIVTANTQDKKIVLENPNLKIISQQGDDISVHSFFELFNTVDKTKKINKKMDKNIGMIKRLKLSFQKKFKKFKTESMLRAKSLKLQEEKFLYNQEEMISKIKNDVIKYLSSEIIEMKNQSELEKDFFVEEIKKQAINYLDTHSQENNASFDMKKEMNNMFISFRKDIEEKNRSNLAKLESKQKDIMINIQNDIVDNAKILKRDIALEYNGILANITKVKESFAKEQDLFFKTIEEKFLKQKDQLDDVQTTREKFKNFTKISQEYIDNTITKALSEVDVVKSSLQSEVVAMSDKMHKEIALIKESLGVYKNEIINTFQDVKMDIQLEMDNFQTQEKDKNIVILDDLRKENETFSCLLVSYKQDIINSKDDLLKRLAVLESDKNSEINSRVTFMQQKLDDILRVIYDIKASSLKEIDDKKRQFLEEFEAIETTKEKFKEFTKISQNYIDGSIKEALMDIETIKVAMNSEVANISELAQQEIINVKERTKEERSKAEEELENYKQKIKEEVFEFRTDAREEMESFMKIIKDENMSNYESIVGKINDFHVTRKEEIIKIISELQKEYKELSNIKSDFNKDITEYREEMAQNRVYVEEEIGGAKEILRKEISYKAQEINERAEIVSEKIEKMKKNIMLELESKRDDILGEVLESSITKEKFKEFTRISQSYIDKSIKETIEDIETIKVAMNSEVANISELAQQEIINVKEKVKHLEMVKQTYQNQLQLLKDENNKTQEEAVRQLKAFVDKNVSEKSEYTLKEINDIKYNVEQSLKFYKVESFDEIITIKQTLQQLISYLKQQRDKKIILTPEKIISKDERKEHDRMIDMFLRQKHD